MEIDPIRMCRLLVGLADISVLGVVDWMPSTPLVVHIETMPASSAVCAGCATEAVTRGRRQVTLTDLPAFGRRTRLTADVHLPDVHPIQAQQTVGGVGPGRGTGVVVGSFPWPAPRTGRAASTDMPSSAFSVPSPGLCGVEALRLAFWLVSGLGWLGWRTWDNPCGCERRFFAEAERLGEGERS